jgi:hypothetical protein
MILLIAILKVGLRVSVLTLILLNKDQSSIRQILLTL